MAETGLHYLYEVIFLRLIFLPIEFRNTTTGCFYMLEMLPVLLLLKSI